jgi:carboxypeptidase PM20D1
MDDQDQKMTVSAPDRGIPWKKLLGGCLAGLVILTLVVLVRTTTFRSKQIEAGDAAAFQIDGKAAAGHLSAAVRFQTVSHQNSADFDAEAFEGFRAFLEATYPLCHEALEWQVINEQSILYKWPGADPEKKPILLLGHYDVVPIEPGTEQDWEHPPFSGEITDGFIWGRGTLDDKSSVLGVLEAVETLIGQSHQPQRTVYLAFGHDEEVGGREGAVRIADHLTAEGVELEFVLDEGMAITNGLVPGLASPVALIGIAEKGYVSVELTVETEGGHSSMPPPQSAVGILSAAVSRLEAHPMPGTLSGPIREMLLYTGPEMPFLHRAVFSNLWLFGPVVKQVLASSNATNASIRTTTAATVIHGGVKDNVLPSSAQATVNFRVLPGDTVDEVLDHVERAIGDPRIMIERLEWANEPSPISDTESASFRRLVKTIGQVFPEAVVAPTLVLGGTDSRHYTKVSENVYRFLPHRMNEEDLQRVHGLNERISLENYLEIIRFYAQLILNSDE